VAEVKALACQLPKEQGLPLSRFSRQDLRRLVIERGIVESISGTTIWRWLDEDAIRPWRYRSWIFPRDPRFAEKAGVVLDLVFLIVDNGSSHRGRNSVERLQRRWPNVRLIHLPVHASWLNQIEIYFSILQRKLLQPNDFPDLASLERAILDFERYYIEIAEPFQWRFTRAQLNRLLARIAAEQTMPAHPAPCQLAA